MQHRINGASPSTEMAGSRRHRRGRATKPETKKTLSDTNYLNSKTSIFFFIHRHRLSENPLSPYIGEGRGGLNGPKT